MTPVEDLKPAFERLRAAHLAHIPGYAERLAALERLGQAVRKYRDELVAAYQPFSPRVEQLRAIRSQLMLRWFDRAEERQVTLGSRRPGQGEIINGLEPGEQIVTQGVPRIRDGLPVRMAGAPTGPPTGGSAAGARTPAGPRQ